MWVVLRMAVPPFVTPNLLQKKENIKDEGIPFPSVSAALLVKTMGEAGSPFPRGWFCCVGLPLLWRVLKKMIPPFEKEPVPYITRQGRGGFRNPLSHIIIGTLNLSFGKLRTSSFLKREIFNWTLSAVCFGEGTQSR
jgi:hypothetical protein